MSQPKKAKRKRLLEGSVCKPCWELKYCPYGPLVEFYPLRRGDGRPNYEIWSVHERALAELMSGTLVTEDQVWDALGRFLYSDPDNWEYIEQYDPEEVGCRIWGHVCPVFFTQSGATETKAG